MKDRAFGILQRVGRSFMLPIAILPVAGLLLGVGSSFTNGTMLQTYGLMKVMGPGTVPYAILSVMSACGNIIFSNLPIIFAIGVAIGMAKQEKAVAALSGAMGFLIMHAAVSTMLQLSGQVRISASNGFSSILPSGSVSMVCGIPSLSMGVFGGVIVGLGVAALNNHFYCIQLPDVLSFFSGTRFVPIISSVVYVFVGILMYFIWPPIQNGMLAIGMFVRSSGYFGTFLYGVTERALIPFGLHHVFYLPFWQTSLGGTTEVAGRLVEGAQNIFFAQLADPSCKSFSVEATRFMTGKFPLMIFGLPGAALAMYQCAKSKKRKVVGGLLLSAALTSMLTGITEPLEFTFLFVAPTLYMIHCVLAGAAYMLMHMLNVRVGMTFSGGIIDMILFGTMQGQSKTNWLMFIPVGIVYFVVYYFLFRYLIQKFHLMTPGREEDDEKTQLYHRSDFHNESSKAALIVQGLGGKHNIIDIDCCITRLRCTVADPNKILDQRLHESGCRGVVKKGNGVQIIYGPTVAVIKSELDEYLDSTASEETGEETEKQAVFNETEEMEMVCLPVTGTVISLDEVEDEVFASGMLGEGVAVMPEDGVIYSPVDGVVSAVFNTNHAVGLVSKIGAEVLVHVGLDTMKLNGKYYHIQVENGTRVCAGDVLGTFDIEQIQKEGYHLTTPVVISNSTEFESITVEAAGSQEHGTPLLLLKKQ